MKKCRKCEIEKDYNSFQKNRNVCKACRNNSSKNIPKNCMQCGEIFMAERDRNKYCSIACRSEASKKKVLVKCSYCKKDKQITPHQFKNRKYYYCDKKCLSSHRSIIFLGENSPRYKRVKIKCVNCSQEFETIPYYEDKKKYCSRECAQNYMIKENHPRFNPELTDEARINGRDYLEYNSWRKDVFSRDDYTCLKCGDSTGGNLVAHHIYNFSEYESLRVEVFNGVTLCKCCHKDFHDNNGYTKNNLAQIIPFLDNKPIPSEVVEKLTERVETTLVL